MTESWIERDVPRPAMSSTMQKLKNDIDFDDLLNNFEHCNNIHEIRPKLEQAAAMVSRLIARRAHSFRVQPSFMYFRKMNIALCRLKELNLHQDIKDIQMAIGVGKTARKLDDKYYLPDENNFFHFLTKFQSFTKLLMRIVICARESHRLFLELLHRSAFIETISLFIAALAEVWSICIEMCKNAVKFYNGFYPFYAKNYAKSKSLPKKLNKWLGEEYAEFIDTSVAENHLKTNEELFLFDGNDDTDRQGALIEQKFEPKLLVSQPIPKDLKASGADDKVGQNKRANVNMFKTQDLLEKPPDFGMSQVKVKPVVSMKALPTITKNFDLGEKISRTSTVAKPVKNIVIEQIKTIKEIREFLSVEDDLRQNQQEQHSKGIKSEEWEKFKATTNNLLILGHHGLVLKKFRNEWKKLLFRHR